MGPERELRAFLLCALCLAVLTYLMTPGRQIQGRRQFVFDRIVIKYVNARLAVQFNSWTVVARRGNHSIESAAGEGFQQPPCLTFVHAVPGACDPHYSFQGDSWLSGEAKKP